MRVLLLFSLFISLNFFALASNTDQSISTLPIIAIDLHWVAPNASTTKIVCKALPMAPSFLWRHPSMVLHAYSISKNAIELSKQVKGISNVLHELNKQLEAQKYGKLSSRELKKLLYLAVMAVPNKEVLKIIDLLRLRGYKLIGMTNRDEYEFEAYRFQLKKEYKLDLDKFFDGFVCAPAFDSFLAKNEPFKYLKPNYFVASERLPAKSYLNALRTLGDSLQLQKLIYCVPTAYHSYFHLLEELNQQQICDIWGIKNFLFSTYSDFIYWLKSLL